MINWSLVVTVAFGVALGLVLIILSLLFLAWLDRRLERRKQEEEERKIREGLRQQVTQLERRLANSEAARILLEAERLRLEGLARERMLQPDEEPPESTTVRTRYERMLASE